MSHRSAYSSGKIKPAAAGGHRGRIYVFLVVALAVFLGGVVLWQRPPHGVAARVKLRHVSGDVEIPINTLASTIASQQAVREVVAGMGRPSSPPDVELIRSKVLVDAHAASRPGEAEIELWYVAGSAEQAKSVVDQLAQRLVNSLADAAKAGSQCGKCDVEKARVQQCQTVLEQANGALNAFIDQHADEFAAKPSPPPVEVSPPKEPLPDIQPAKAAPPIAERLNPEWVDLDDRLQVLRAARDELLTKRTEAHPEVVDLQWQIEKLEGEQSLVRRTVAPVVGPEVEEEIAADDPVEAPQDEARDVEELTPELLQRRESLTAAVDAAQSQLKAAQQAEENAKLQHHHPVFASAEIVEPARIVSRRGGGVSRGGMLFAGLVAIVIGLMATWRSQVVAQPAQLD